MAGRTVAHRLRSGGVLSPDEWAQIIVEEARGLHLKLTPRQVAEGVATVQLESSGDSSNESQGPDGHIGAWAEEPGFGSEDERLDPRASTRAALRDWASNGKSFWQAWGKWEKEQSGHSGSEPSEYGPYLGIAEKALGKVGRSSPAHPSSPRAKTNSKGGADEEGGGGGPGGIAGDALHFGLVAVLVLGGVVMMGLGVTRTFGAARAR